MCDEIIDAETKTVTTNFNEKMQSVKQKNYVLLFVSLIIIALLIAFSIYCFFIK